MPSRGRGSAPPPSSQIPLLKEIPILGDSLFSQHPIVYVGIALAFVVGWVLRRTSAGLSIRAAGERPEALDAAGVSVTTTRTLATLCAGAFAGLGGAYLALVGAGTFTPFITQGAGFIAIVIAMLSRGKAPWTIVGAVLFGMSLVDRHRATADRGRDPDRLRADAAVRRRDRRPGAVRAAVVPARGAGAAVRARGEMSSDLGEHSDADEERAMHEPDFTLSAGPTMSSLRVQQAQGRPMIFDYDPVFQERFRETERLVAELFQTTKDVVLMQGEAVLGIEAAARGVVTPGLKCLNLVSGVYAKWFGAWLRDYGAEVVEVEVPYDEALDPAQVHEELERHGDFELVALVHSETPSGVENPLAEIGPMAKDAGALMFADVVSAVGGTELLTDEWGVDIAIGGPQKCLAGPPGMSLCVISEDAWAAIERNPNAPRGSFLSLLDWRETWIKGGRVKYPYTPSVSDVNGVHAAVGECLDDGLDEVIARHATAARACREGVKAMGLELWPRSEDYAAHCVTAVRCPEGAEVKPTLAHIRERYGVMLSGGYGELTERLFRLGHMGPGARSLYPVVAVSAFGRGLADLGVDVDLAAGVEAALQVLSESQAAVAA